MRANRPYRPTCVALLALSAVLQAGEPEAAASRDDSDTAGIFDAIAPVTAASLHSQTLEEAPATVTVVTADEIRRYGYRTLGEALSHVRGFYTSYDRTYTGAGVRGFSVPGDYNTRFLVMIDGHNMTENVYGSNNYFGQDFGLDLDLVKRIEIIRGPSSTLYGSNGILATINVVTLSPEEGGTIVSTEAGSFGSKKIFGATSLDLKHGANLLLAGSLYGARGPDLYFPEFDRTETNFGKAFDLDGERAYHTFAKLIYGGWHLTAYFNARRKSDPSAPYGTIFNRESAVSVDTRDFVELGYLKETGSGTWRWRLYYDRYQYEGFWDYASDVGIHTERDYSLGTFIGSQVTYRRELTSRLGAISIGVEGVGEIKALQQFYAGEPETVMLDSDNPDRRAAVFLQHELNLSPRTSLTSGVRLDGSLTRRGYLSPRLALIHRQSKNNTWKLMYGRAFRNPTTYERFYTDAVSQLPNPDLAPESGTTIEGALERKLGTNLTAAANAYRYSLDRLITAQDVSDSLFRFTNRGRVDAYGVEFEFSGRPHRILEIGASLAVQRIRDDRAATPMPNSPARLWKGRIGTPIHRKLFVGTEFRETSRRYTRAGVRLGSFHLLDATLSTVELSPHFDLVAGVRNVLGCSYNDPAPYGRVMDSLRQDGRSYFVKLVWRAGDR